MEENSNSALNEEEKTSDKGNAEQSDKDTNERKSISERTTEKLSISSKINSKQSPGVMAEKAREILNNIKTDYNLMVKLHNLTYTPEKMKELACFIEELQKADYRQTNNMKEKKAKHAVFKKNLKTSSRNFDDMIRAYTIGLVEEDPARNLLPEQSYKQGKIYEKLTLMKKFITSMQENYKLKSKLDKYYPWLLREGIIESIEKTDELYKEFKFLEEQIQQDTEFKNKMKEKLMIWIKLFHKACITGIEDSQLLEKVGLKVSPAKPRKKAEDETPDDQPDGNEPDVGQNSV